jgi:phosphoribosyl-AMP cyclohydrolase
MTVTMESGALMYMSRKATHAWLQAEADGKSKQESDAAGARSAPKL